MKKALLLVDLIKGFGQEGYDKNMYCQNVEKIKKNIQELAEYAESFPDDAVLLIDTYNTWNGAQNACIVGNELSKKGYDLKGVRMLLLYKEANESNAIVAGTDDRSEHSVRLSKYHKYL